MLLTSLLSPHLSLLLFLHLLDEIPILSFTPSHSFYHFTTLLYSFVFLCLLNKPFIFKKILETVLPWHFESFDSTNYCIALICPPWHDLLFILTGFLMDCISPDAMISFRNKIYGWFKPCLLNACDFCIPF